MTNLPDTTWLRIFLTRRREWGMVLASFLFFGSFMLPAFGDSANYFSGWECLNLCISSLGTVSDAYFWGFVVINLGFVGVVPCAWLKPRMNWWIFAAVAACALYVISWFVLMLFQEPEPNLSALKVGYYVWLASFLLLAFSVFPPSKARVVPPKPLLPNTLPTPDP